MSDKDIHKGERWSQQIGNQLEGHRVGIVCVTPENMTAEWLLFEAGALSKTVGDARVCPLLLGIRSSDIEGPLAQFQATVFERDEMFALANSLNHQLGDDRVDDQVLKDGFDKFWPELEGRVRSISQLALAPQSVPQVVRTFAKYGFPEPQVGGTVYFSGGFESHALYETVCSVATQRLFVFGRKNRKLFDKEHADFIRSLPERLASGFDFRCLFLDPNAPAHVLSAAHQDASFRDQLKAAARGALTALSSAGLDPDRHCRTYKIQRSVTTITVDDAVLYTHIRLMPSGQAAKLTKCAFTVANARSSVGEELTNEFLDLWSSGELLSSLEL